jgi:hypothetical protein
MKILRFYEMSIKFYQTTQRHIPEDGVLHSHRYDKL